MTEFANHEQADAKLETENLGAVKAGIGVMEEMIKSGSNIEQINEAIAGSQKLTPGVKKLLQALAPGALQSDRLKEGK